MGVATLQVTNNPGTYLSEADLDSFFGSIATYTQTSIVNNLNQIAKDAWGTTYTLDNDGSANRTYNLYNKHYVLSEYTSSITVPFTATTNRESTAALRVILSPEATPGAYFFHADVDFGGTFGSLGVRWHLRDITNGTNLFTAYNGQGDLGYMERHRKTTVEGIATITGAATYGLFYSLSGTSSITSAAINYPRFTHTSTPPIVAMTRLLVEKI